MIVGWRDPRSDTLPDNRLDVGALEKTRTSTSIQKLAPEASASTNSATRADDQIASLKARAAVYGTDGEWSM